MNDFILVIDFVFELLTDIFNLLMGNWFTALIVMLSIFSFIISAMLIVKGDK